MDARSDVYMLNNGCRKCSDDSDGYYWYRLGSGLPSVCWIKQRENVLGMEIVRDQSGNTLRESQSRMVSGHIYAVGSQEYQVVCTRPDIASADVDILDGFDRGLQTNV
ncbi:hypothetical protein Tco_0192390 [Tanacetum coccineum]